MNIHLIPNVYFVFSYSAILARLDDGNDKVRLFAVETLCTLFMARPESYDADAHNGHIENLYNAMLLHLDDPDPNFQDFVLGKYSKYEMEILFFVVLVQFIFIFCRCTEKTL